MLAPLPFALQVPILFESLRGKVSFKGKHVLITGGSKGIGLELARAFLGQGATVTLAARNKAALQAAKQQLEAEGVPAASVCRAQYLPSPADLPLA